MKLISIPALAAFATILGAFAQPTKPAPKPKAEIQEVKATGCTIIIDGKPHAGSTACKQGIALDVTGWESTGEKCLR